MKIISFSLWGDHMKYIGGALSNVEEAKLIYPDWVCRFYVDSSVPELAVEKLQSSGAEVIIVKSRGSWDGLFWRFWAMDDPNANVVIIRDTDSIVSSRERAAVEDWLDSDFELHGMRDHLDHNVPIMGGMWGCKNPSKVFGGNLTKKISDWINAQTIMKGADQEFLKNEIWADFRSQMLTHDRFMGRAFKLPDGEILSVDDVVFYNKWQGQEEEYPDGRIEFKDKGSFQRLDVYEYDAIEYFGPHEIRAFPFHEPMKYGSYVGEIVSK